MRGNSILGVLMAMVLVVASCGSTSEPVATPQQLQTIAEIIGTEVEANRVVSLPCIPSRRDPVGVWLAVRVVDARVEGDVFALALRETDARLGSHPSGCRRPKTLLAQSVFVIGPDEQPVFADRQLVDEDVTTLRFPLGSREPTELEVVILPTLEFEMGNGERQTTIFGLMGRYAMG